MLLLALTFAHIICHQSVLGQTPTTDDIDELRSALKAEYDASGRFRDLLTATVRLAFHDCGGPQEINGNGGSRCNGCIDFQNTDHNNLVQSAVDPLNQIYTQFSSRMNPADFLMAAGTVAIEYAQQLDTSSSDSLPSISYYFGRTSCNTAEIGDATDSKSFVSGDGGWDHVSQWFETNMAFNERETVTIIGAHSLGRCHRDASGYSSLPWVAITDGPDHLNNLFYKNLLDIAWTQSSNGIKYEWKDATGDILMINADMSMVLGIDNYIDTSGGQVICPVTNGCPDSTVKPIVQEFAANNGLWLREFATVWDKMIKTGYTDNELTEVSANTFNYIDGGNNGGNGGGGRGGGGGGRGGRAMSIGSNNNGIFSEWEENEGNEYYLKMIAMYPIMYGILLMIVIINTFIVCQIKLRGDRVQEIGIKQYESVSHDPEDISFS